MIFRAPEPASEN